MADIRVSFRLENGSTIECAGASDGSVMTVAVCNDVPGIVGECGGQMSCATCHVYLLGGPADPPSDDEMDMLELVNARRPDSRLGCQISLAGSEASQWKIEVPPAP